MLVNLVSFALRQALANNAELVLRVTRPIVDQVEAIGALAVETYFDIGRFTRHRIVDELR